MLITYGSFRPAAAVLSLASLYQGLLNHFRRVYLFELPAALRFPEAAAYASWFRGLVLPNFLSGNLHLHLMRTANSISANTPIFLANRCVLRLAIALHSRGYLQNILLLLELYCDRYSAIVRARI